MVTDLLVDVFLDLMFVVVLVVVVVMMLHHCLQKRHPINRLVLRLVFRLVYPVPRVGCMMMLRFGRLLLFWLGRVGVLLGRGVAMVGMGGLFRCNRLGGRWIGGNSLHCRGRRILRRMQLLGVIGC